MNDRTGTSVLILEVTGLTSAAAVSGALPAARGVRVWPFGRLGDQTVQIAFGPCQDRVGARAETLATLRGLGLGVLGGRWTRAA